MAKTRASRRRPRPTPDDLILDGFFEAWSRADTREIANAIRAGHVTGAALARALKWTRDKVSRRTDELRSGGLVAKRRDNGWVKTTMTTDGVEAARRWAKFLQVEPPSDPTPSAWTDEERMRASGALASADRRRLLDQLVTTPGATQADLAASCGVSQPAVSRDLKELKAAGFVELQRDGGRARHHVRTAAVERLREWLDDYALKLAYAARVSEAVVLPRAGEQPANATAPAQAPSPSPSTGVDAPPAAAPAASAPHDLNDNESLDGSGGVSGPDGPSPSGTVDAA